MAAEVWQPSVEFYAQDERSWCIRSVCLEVLAALEKVLKLKARPKTYTTDLLTQYSVLERLDGMLRSLEIEPGLHPEIDLGHAHPNLVAEWLASQLQPWTGPSLDHLNDPATLQSLLDIFYVYFDATPPENL